MVKTGIKIFARLRPTKKTTGVYEVVQSRDGLEALSFTVPRSEAGGAVNNRRETFSFKFSRVFDSNTGQEEVFDAVSREVIDNCLEGYNGTIFAYGQTGSGKTFTITGGVERFSDRGLIPRSLSYLFQQYHKSPGTIFTTHISYLEIYNECGYDLLDPRHETARLEDLPKVSLMEDRESVIHLRNLSLHPTNNEEEALNWLFLGDTNRVMAETPMNMASTRSHCIFTVHISAREPSSELIRRAKLHLVDLAGSERVGRTGVEGILLTEVKYINLSLHFLEQVIVALSDKSRSHVPYRNSMMTSVLRDSLGGNCMTSMIATCSVEKRNIDETISTCRFSQRVALIKNEVRINEELDPKLMVRQLRQQVAELREELSLATGGEERDGDLELAERERCERLVQDYLQDSSPEARLLVGGDMRRIQLCFSLLKARVKSPPLHTAPKTVTPTNQPTVTADPRLEEVIRQRDEEINMLLKTLKQEQRKIAELEARLKTISPEERGVGGEEMEERKEERVKEEEGTETGGQESGERQLAESRKAWKSELSRARQEAFDQFRRDCPVMDQVNQHKTDLRTKYSEAKALGEEVQSSRTTINELKGQLERHRISQGLAGLTRGVSSEVEGQEERERELKTKIEAEKARFRSLYQRLRGMKTEIEHTQHLLHMAKVKVQQEFEAWWQNQVAKGGGASRCAWRTPPISIQLQKPLPQNSAVSSECSVVSSSGRHEKSLGHNSEKQSSGHHSSQSGQHRSGQTSDQSGAAIRNAPLAIRTPTHPQPLFHSSHLSPPPPSKLDPLTTPHMVPLTGDPRADADILAFCRARQHLLNNRGPR